MYLKEDTKLNMVLGLAKNDIKDVEYNTAESFLSNQPWYKLPNTETYFTQGVKNYHEDDLWFFYNRETGCRFSISNEIILDKKLVFETIGLKE